MDFIKIGKIFAQDYYAVPDYQRDYEWTSAQNSTLLDDLMEITRQNNNNHFFGAIVTIPYESDNAINKCIDLDDYSISDNIKHVVDGQQRLTTFSILIKALRDLICEDSSVDDTFKKNFAERQLENLLLGNNYHKVTGEAAPRLILNGNTGVCYINEILHVSTENYSKVYKGAKRIIGAYAQFKTEIMRYCTDYIAEGVCNDNKDFYRKLIDALTNKVVFVEIECDASSDAFQVFDSLNGKGLDLTAADRIKNIFLSWSAGGKGIQKWDSLVGLIGDDYLAGFFVSLFFYSSKKRISKNKLPDEFKKLYKESATTDFDYFYSKIKEEGTLYGQLRDAKTGISDLDSVLSDFKSLNLEQVYVLIFAAANHYGTGTVSNPDYLELVKVLQKLAVRMQVCEKSMNRLDNLFSVCIEKMKSGNASLAVITKTLQDEITLKVDDTIFETSFKSFAPTDNKVAEYYLRHIENIMREEAGNRSKVDRGLTVEHIIPMTLEKVSDWYGNTPVPLEIQNDFKDSVVQNIGNKALLYGDDNSSASNNEYSKKRDVYINGKRGQNQGTPQKTFELIKELLKDYPTTFNHDEVYKRAEKLATYAVKKW